MFFGQPYYPELLGISCFHGLVFRICCFVFFHSKFELFPFESAVLRLCIIKSYFHFLLQFFFSFLFIFINLNNADMLMNLLKITMSISNTLILHSPSITWKMIMKKTRNPIQNCGD